MTQVRKKLSLFDSCCLMIGVVIGAGIFESAPIIARQFPDIVSFYMIWLIGGVLSLAGALCYVELATVYPEDGGDYAYLRRTYGNLFGFLFAWSKVLIIRPGSIAVSYTHLTLPTICSV